MSVEPPYRQSEKTLTGVRAERRVALLDSIVRQTRVDNCGRPSRSTEKRGCTATERTSSTQTTVTETKKPVVPVIWHPDLRQSLVTRSGVGGDGQCESYCRRDEMTVIQPEKCTLTAKGGHLGRGDRARRRGQVDQCSGRVVGRFNDDIGDAGGEALALILPCSCPEGREQSEKSRFGEGDHVWV